ncbi:hypothetical protein FA15DRAFT_568591, partial [Coprinopsis marcescibilis]
GAPPLTGFRLLVIVSVAGFGILKASLSYSGVKTAPTLVEWFYGVCVAVCLFILGLYEADPTNFLPWLFRKDY